MSSGIEIDSNSKVSDMLCLSRQHILDRITGLTRHFLVAAENRILFILLSRLSYQRGRKRRGCVVRGYQHHVPNGTGSTGMAGEWGAATLAVAW